MAVACSTSAFTCQPLDDALRAIHELGFAHVDLLAIEGWAHVMPSDLVIDYEATVERVQNLLRRYALTPVAINASVGPLLHDRSAQACAVRDAQTRALVRFMTDLKIGVMTLGPRETDKSRPQEEVLRAAAASLRDTLAITGPAGITVALECHINSVAETVAASLALLDSVPGLYVAYDPSHLVMQGVDLAETLALMDHAGQVHLRDAGRNAMQKPYGQGEVDFDWLLDTLQQRGYRGPISIEYLDMGGAAVEPDILAIYGRCLAHGLA